MGRGKAWIVVCTVLLAACSGGNDYSDEVRENFLAACHLGSGGQDDYCECTLNYLEENMTEAEFLELDAKGQEAFDSDVRFEQALERCS
jgi:hypothetical protein